MKIEDPLDFEQLPMPPSKEFENDCASVNLFLKCFRLKNVKPLKNINALNTY